MFTNESAAFATDNCDSSAANKKVAPLWKQSHRERRLHQAAALRQPSGLGSNMVYNCDVCGKAFGYLFSMKKHREKHAPFITGGSFQPSFAGEEHHLCIQCNRLFSCYASLKRHQLTTHTENGPVFHCPYCPYSNPFSWQVKRHIYKRHGHEETYFCGGCKKFFKTGAERERHVCTAPVNNRFRQHHQQHSEQHGHNNSVSNGSANAGQNRDEDYYDGDGDNDVKMRPFGGDMAEMPADLAAAEDSNHKVVPSEGVEPGDDSNQAMTRVSSSADGNNDTPCICSECGTCLPCFEAMVKHQATHRTATANSISQADDGPTPLISTSRLNRNQVYMRSSSPSNRFGLGQVNESTINNGNQSSASRSGAIDQDSKTNRAAKRHLITSNSLLAMAKQEPGSNNAVVFSSPDSFGDREMSSPLSSASHAVASHHQFECSYCGISFTDPALWGLHSTMHDVNDLRKCNFCGRQAKDKYDFWRHFIDHSKLPTVSSMASPPASSSSTVKQDASSVSVSSVEAASK